MLRAKLADSDEAPRIAIVGIGNELRCDDAAGSLVARGLRPLQQAVEGSPWLVYRTLVMDAGQAPENLTGDLRGFRPGLILFVDAAEMGKAPGSIRWIAMDEIDGMSASTHRMPISMLATYLSLELRCDIVLLGIQPATVDLGEGLSLPVRRAVDLITNDLGDLLMLRAVEPVLL
jgi:hydrogenase 3 maturation protease